MTGEKERIETAKGICSGCEVREECLQYSIRTSSLGIWGGLDTRERLRGKR